MRNAWPGALAALLILTLMCGTVSAVLWRAEGQFALSATDWAALRFTVVQALVSAGVSVLLAVPVARALARRRFLGRGILVTLMGAPFILPVIVAVLGLITVFGRNGWMSDLARLVGLPPLEIYGFHGVILGHVFFNLPLATRLILQGWLAIPAERFRLAASLGFTSKHVARQLEWPMLRAVLPGTFMVIFLICTTSFAVALTLGGGPRATTVELAIYQAFRFDFDLSRAALLALVQLALSGVAAVLALWVAVPQNVGRGLDRTVERWDARTLGLRCVDTVLIAAAAAFLLAPLAAIGLRGLPGLGALPPEVWPAAWRSIWVALLSVVVTVILALSMGLSIVALKGRGFARAIEAVGYLSIAASPLVLGTGLFLLLFPIADPIALALPVTAMINAVMSLPFALRTLIPALTEIETQYGRLADNLGLTGINRLRQLTLPRLRRPLGFAAAIAAALSMGDLGVITLFSDPQAGTLPLLLYQLMGAYRLEQAGAVALILLALSIGIFWIFDRGGRVDADT